MNREPGLVCAATREELEAFGLEEAESAGRDAWEGRLFRIREGFAAVTGAGVPMTLLTLLPLLRELRPAWLLNTGIAGAYPGSGLAIGEVVAGSSEIFADLGAELPGEERFRPLGEFPFAADLHRFPLPLWLPAWTEGVARAAGATVNSCTGTEETGGLRRRLFGAGFESMEGAAAALAGLDAGIPVCEARAISNLASVRDMRPGNVRLALDALRGFWRARRNRARTG